MNNEQSVINYAPRLVARAQVPGWATHPRQEILCRPRPAAIAHFAARAGGKAACWLPNRHGSVPLAAGGRMSSMQGNGVGTCQVRVTAS